MVAPAATHGAPVLRPINSMRGYESLRPLVRSLASYFDAVAVSIAVVDPRAKELVYVSTVGPGAEAVLGMRLPSGTGLAGSTAATGVSEVVPDVRADPRFAEHIAALTGYIPESMLLVPLKLHGAIVGVLNVLDRNDGLPYDDCDLVVAEAFAQLVLPKVHIPDRGTGWRFVQKRAVVAAELA